MNASKYNCLLIAASLCVAIFTSCGVQSNRIKGVAYVNPLIGTTNSVAHTAGLFGKGTEELGQTLPAVLEPNGMNFWTAQTRDTEQKCVAPYYYDDVMLQGFRNSHWIVGGCTQDYGSMTLMPLFGKLRTTPEKRATWMTKGSEKATPYLYSVSLPEERILAEMTATSRAAIFRFTYGETGDGWLVVNPNSDEGQGYIEIDLKERQIRGYNPVHRIYQGWGEPAGFSGWFVVEWDESLDVTAHGTYHGNDVYEGEDKISDTTEIGAFIKFSVEEGENVLVKAASSFTSMEGALANLNAEIPDFDFEKTKSRLEGIWDERLALINIPTDNIDNIDNTDNTDNTDNIDNTDNTDNTKFYSALYRTSFLPRTFSDVDGSYPSFATGSPIRKMPEGKTYYEDFSMWDTYRALHPLLNIIDPEKSGEMMNSLVMKYEQGGWLPIFPCWNSYTAAMIGDHCISVLADAHVKGIKGFDIEKAYEGMRKNAFEMPSDINEYRNGMGRRALDSYLKYGYIPVEDSVPDAFHQKEQVSRTLEYAYDDFALAQVAKSLGKTDDYNALMARSKNYVNAINPVTGYAAPKDTAGNFLPIDPFSFSKNITEGAPCHYTWYVPHDQEGLIRIMGGREAYAAKLDSMFTQRRYWHGNEPCHQIAWLFPYAGMPEKTAQYVRHIMETEYLDTPGGLAGNDDAGQMSAWYVFAALGFYPVCPATDEYILGVPAFRKIEINVGNGKKFTIIRDGDPEGKVTKITLNGEEITDYKLHHADIMAGGKLVFE